MVFNNLYSYVVITIITKDGQKLLKMGCKELTIEEWEENFWNNDKEFPNDGNAKSNMRLAAYNFAKEWFKNNA